MQAAANRNVITAKNSFFINTDLFLKSRFCDSDGRRLHEQAQISRPNLSWESHKWFKTRETECQNSEARGRRMSIRQRGIPPGVRASRYFPVSALYCAGVNGTTESLPWRTRGESAKSLLALISCRETGRGSAS